MIYRDNDGLTVAEHSMSEQQVQAELKRLDSDLILYLRGRDIQGDEFPPRYEVHKFVSRDREAQYVCSWWDEYMQPLPLSFGLVEKVKGLRLEHDSARLHEAANQAIRDAASQEMYDETYDIAADMLPRIKGETKTLLQRSQSLRMARDKSRQQR